MARVLLAKARHFTFEQRALVPPLGPLYLASVLREAGHEVALFDPGRERPGVPRFEDVLKEFGPDVVGLSAITFESGALFEMAGVAKATCPGVPVVVGGAHATAYPEACARHPAIDFVIRGEGERSFPALVGALTGRLGLAPSAIPGIATADGKGDVVFGPPPVPIEDLDALPFPAWDLVDHGHYSGQRSMSTVGHRPYMPLVTSRGCPYRCIYCHRVHGKRLRARSPGSVVAEMTALRDRFGIRDYEIVDDTFNLDRERLVEIADRIIASGLEPTIQFPNGLRTDLLDERQIRALARAGTQYLSVAVETASPRLQRLIRKRLDLERVRENIGHAVRAGIFTNGFFMLGFPTETREEAAATVDFAVRSPLHQALFFTVTPFAGTDLFEQYRDLLRARGVPEELGAVDYYATRYNLSDMPDDVLFGLQREAYRRFYVDPVRIARIFARHPRRADLIDDAVLALRKMLPRGIRRGR